MEPPLPDSHSVGTWRDRNHELIEHGHLSDSATIHRYSESTLSWIPDPLAILEYDNRAAWVLIRHVSIIAETAPQLAF